MNSGSVLVLLNFAVLSEAMFFRFPWSSRVLPGGDKDEVLDTMPNTPTSIKPNYLREVNNRKVATFTIDTESFNNNIASKKRESVKKLKSLLSPANITNGFDSLTEKGAAELLKLDERLMTEILDNSSRYQFLLAAFNIDTDNLRGVNTPTGVIKFTMEVGEKLKETVELKGFLKILVEFYKICLSHLVLDDVLSAVMKSEAFTLDELPEALGMNHQEIFSFACTKNIPAAAKSLITSQKITSTVVMNGVSDAFMSGNEALGNELVLLIGENFGTDSDSLYHQILNDLATIQLAINVKT